jgi:tetratricopeptide (TPR) repeat protein
MSKGRTRGTTTPVVPVRSRRPWIVLACVVGFAAAGWLAGGAMARRAQATRLPPLPDLAAVPQAVRDDLVAADAGARADPGSAAAVGDLGIAFHGATFSAPALQAYALAAVLDPTDWRWAYHRGLLLEERGDHAAALDAFLRVTTAAPSYGPAWFHVAEIQFKRSDAAAAEAAYRRVIEAPAVPPTPVAGVNREAGLPLAAYAELGLARLLAERGARDDAIAVLDRAVERYPAFGPARTMRRRLRNADDTRARADDRGAYVPPADPQLDVVVARSHHPEVLLKHAALAGRRGDGEWRLFLARRALAAEPRALDVLMEMSATLQASGRLTEALDYLRQAETVAPGDHHILVEQGKNLSDLGRLDEAEKVLRRACRVRDAAAEYNLATVLDRTERWDEARAHYEQALAINPFHTRAMNNLGVGLDRRGQTPAALALYARALSIAPDDAEVLSNLGSALINQRRFGEALDALRAAVDLAPDAPNARNNLGIALAQSGQLDAALVEFRAALRLDPRHANAQRNVEAISRLKQR